MANLDSLGEPEIPTTITPHAGRLVYHCRRCDTHVSMTVAELAGRDITHLCLCGLGIVTREPGDTSISQPWPVRPRKAEPPLDPNYPIARREAADKARHAKRREWVEGV